MQETKRTNDSKRWAVILAGGDGRRLQPLTRVISGDDRPKQFCSIFGGPTLLDETRRRLSLSFPKKQILTVLTQTHEAFYKPLMRSHSRRLLVQPTNRGTAPAILLSLLRVRQLSQDAIVAFFPSDHHINNDLLFMSDVES